MTQDNPDWQQGVNIEEADVNSVPIDIVAQAIGNVAVDIAAQSLATLGIDIEAQSIDVDTNIASQSVTLDMNLTASSATVDTNITGQNVTLNTDIAAQSIQDLAVDVTAQTLSNLDINVNAQDIGVADASQFQAEQQNVTDAEEVFTNVSAGSSSTATLFSNNTGGLRVVELVTVEMVDEYGDDASATLFVDQDGDGTDDFSVGGNVGNFPIPLTPGLAVQDGGSVDAQVQNFTSSGADFTVTILHRAV